MQLLHLAALLSFAIGSTSYATGNLKWNKSKCTTCPRGQECINISGTGRVNNTICIEPVFCGGFAGFLCKPGMTCIDDPRDGCNPDKGGRDCGGLCIPDRIRTT